MYAVRAFVCCAIFAAVPVLVSFYPKKERPYPHAYCIDPFASVDLGQAVYTDCKLVPMWSMKV